MDKPRMTEGQLRRARKLIRRLCANYDEGNCLALDEGEGCVCVQSISYSLLCRYFKEAVLRQALPGQKQPGLVLSPLRRF